VHMKLEDPDIDQYIQDDRRTIPKLASEWVSVILVDKTELKVYRGSRFHRENDYQEKEGFS
jgi:hypothetical protein